MKALLIIISTVVMIYLSLVSWVPVLYHWGSNIPLEIFGVIAGIVIIYLSLAIRWVQAPYNWVVEINLPVPWIPQWIKRQVQDKVKGDVSSTIVMVWQPGFHLLPLPVKPIMYVRKKINMAQKPVTLHLGKKDGLGRADPVEFLDTKADALIQVIYQVKNPELATYAVEESALTIVSRTIHDQEFFEMYTGYERATLNLVEALFRGEFGSITFDEANANAPGKKGEALKDQPQASIAPADSSKKPDSSEEPPDEEVTRNSIEAYVKQEAKEQLSKWGVELILVDIIDFSLEEETSTIRQGRLKAEIGAEVAKKEAEGRKNALVIDAEGQRKSTVIVAEGYRDAAKLAGQGEQERIKMVTEGGLTSGEAAAYILAQGSTEALGHARTTVVATSNDGNLSQLTSMAGMWKGVLGGGGDNSPPINPPKGSSSLDSTTDAPPPSQPEQNKGGNQRRRGNNKGE